MADRGLSADEVTAVYHRYGALLERRCRILMRDHALAEDALQELLTALLRRGESLREAESPYAGSVVPSIGPASISFDAGNA